MKKLKIDLKELKAALAELEIRSKDAYVVISLDDRTVSLTATDSSNNMMEAIIFSDSTMCAQFKYTERLMYMKNNKK